MSQSYFSPPLIWYASITRFQIALLCCDHFSALFSIPQFHFWSLPCILIIIVLQCTLIGPKAVLYSSVQFLAPEIAWITLCYSTGTRIVLPNYKKINFYWLTIILKSQNHTAKELNMYDSIFLCQHSPPWYAVSFCLRLFKFFAPAYLKNKTNKNLDIVCMNA